MITSRRLKRRLPPLLVLRMRDGSKLKTRTHKIIFNKIIFKKLQRSPLR
jgi:hypothetical protein